MKWCLMDISKKILIILIWKFIIIIVENEKLMNK
jgi:hypothetical protein